MFLFPEFDPVFVRLGPLAIHWYGMMYLLGFTSAFLLANYRIRTQNSYLKGWTPEQFGDLMTWCIMGVIVGGRMGYMLFYDFTTLLDHPLTLFKIWQGGMSFHGGMLGVILAIYCYGHRRGRSFFYISDLAVPLVPLALGAGRMGNFINGELWGRVTYMPWGVIFPHVDAFPRHPSQLYELGLEGLVLFAVLWGYSNKARPKGAVSGLFLVGYSLARIFVEFFRMPDAQFGYLALGFVTMGQLLSIPMLLLGVWLIRWAYRHNESRLRVS